MLEGVAGVIVAIGTLLGAVGALLLTIRNGHRQTEAKAAALAAAAMAEEAKKEVAVIDGQIRQLGQAVDGRLTQLLEEMRKAALAEGMAQGRAEERAEGKDDRHDRAAAAAVIVAAAKPGDAVDVKIVGTRGNLPVEVRQPKEPKKP